MNHFLQIEFVELVNVVWDTAAAAMATATATAITITQQNDTQEKWEVPNNKGINKIFSANITQPYLNY